MIGSARVGERRLLALLDEYGPKTVAGAVEEILDGAERQARKCVRSWTDGVYHGETILDDDGHGTTDIWICADRKSTRLNSSHGYISYAVFCLKKKKTQ